MVIDHVHAKAIQTIHLHALEEGCLIYIQALGFVRARIATNQERFLHHVRIHEQPLEQYEKSSTVVISGDYNFSTKQLTITHYQFLQDAA